MEIFRNNTEIREIIVSKDQNPDGLEMTQIFEMLYQNKHFLNRKFIFIIPKNVYSTR